MALEALGMVETRGLTAAIEAAAPEKQDANLENARYGKNKSLKITSEREEFSRRPDEVSGLRELQRVRRVWTHLQLPLQRRI